MLPLLFSDLPRKNLKKRFCPFIHIDHFVNYNYWNNYLSVILVIVTSENFFENVLSNWKETSVRPKDWKSNDKSAKKLKISIVFLRSEKVWRVINKNTVYEWFAIFQNNKCSNSINFLLNSGWICVSISIGRRSASQCTVPRWIFVWANGRMDKMTRTGQNKSSFPTIRCLSFFLPKPSSLRGVCQ